MLVWPLSAVATYDTKVNADLSLALNSTGSVTDKYGQTNTQTDRKSWSPHLSTLLAESRVFHKVRISLLIACNKQCGKIGYILFALVDQEDFIGDMKLNDESWV